MALTSRQKALPPRLLQAQAPDRAQGAELRWTRRLRELVPAAEFLCDMRGDVVRLSLRLQPPQLQLPRQMPLQQLPLLPRCLPRRFLHLHVVYHPQLQLEDRRVLLLALLRVQCRTADQPVLSLGCRPMHRGGQRARQPAIQPLRGGRHS